VPPVTEGQRHLYGSSFGAAAAAYAEHRPDYATDAVQWALELAPGSRVLDLGAGTGKLTATLVDLGADVTAVEPDPKMLAELQSALPTVRALPGRAEAIPLPDSAVDAVVSGNAMHWFDMDVAGPEIARILTPGGVLAVVSGQAAIGPRDTTSGWRTATANVLPDGGRLTGYGPPERAEFPHGQHRTAHALVATLATKAGMIVMPEHEREAALARIRTYLTTRPETARGEFTLPMQTCVLRVQRL
jgi:SAM-dependent methyltransferase